MGPYPAIPIALVIAIFGVFAAHSLRMRTEKNYREMWGSACIGVLPVSTFLLFIVSQEASMVARNIYAIPIGAIVGACVFAYVGYVISDLTPVRAQPQKEQEHLIHMAQLVPSAQGPVIDQSVTSYNQQGGITAHSVVIGPQQRNLDLPAFSELKSQILSQLPRDKDITVMAILGDTESITFAQQIHSFLKNNSFKLKEPSGISQGVFTSPVKGLQFNPETDVFIVGAQ